MSDGRIVLYISERDNPFDSPRLDALLGVILERPFGDYDRMALDLEDDPDDFGPVDEAALSSHLSAGDTSTAYLRGGEREGSLEGEVEVIISRSPDENLLRVQIDRDDFRESGGVERLRAAIPRLAAAFPNLDHGSARVAIGYPDYYREIGLRKMPRCFDVHLKWLHLMGPPSYEHLFSKETLLACPAFALEELPGDVLLIQNFEDPWDYDTTETKARLAEVTEFVYDKLG